MSNDNSVVRINRTIDIAANSITFKASDDSVVIVVDCGAFSQDVLDYAKMHGLNQTIGDAAALDIKEEGGTMRRPTVAEKFAAMQARIDNLKEHGWNAPRAESTGGFDASVFREAFARVTGKDVAAATGACKTLTVEQVKVLRKEPRMAAAMLTIRAERAASAPKDESASSLLDSFTAPAGKTKKSKSE